MESETVIDIRNLRHAYKNHVAVADVTFTVHSRSIHGFVGPNGAGKTTTLKILATLLRPQAGGVRVFGHDTTRERKEVRRKIAEGAIRLNDAKVDDPQAAVKTGDKVSFGAKKHGLIA